MIRFYTIIMILLIANSFSVSRILAQETPTGVIEHDTPPYEVTDGKVDRSTYLGWRVFHSACYICHGVDAVGTDVAPNLIERVGAMSGRDFAIAVLYRYPMITGLDEAPSDDLASLREAFTEQISKAEQGNILMPGWEYDPEVKPHVFDIYAYLRARADGVLGPGEPALLVE